MVQPINYMLDVQNPVQASMAGLTQGMQIGQFMQNKKIAEQKALQEQQMQQEFDAFALKPNKTTEDFVSMMVRYPNRFESLQGALNAQSSSQKEATFKTASRVYAALRSNNPSRAKSILETEAQGYENADRQEEAAALRQLAGFAIENPQDLLIETGFTMSAINPEWAKSAFDAQNQNQMLPEEINLKKAQIGKIEAETEHTEIENNWLPQEKTWNIENIKSQIGERSGRLQLDRDALETNTQLKLEELGQSNIKLSPGAEKIVNDAVMDSAAALTQSQKLKGLADKFEKEGQSGGWWTSGWTGFRKATGWSNDDQTAMMREYDRLISSEVNKSLPPGPATDKDIEIARKGFPPATADSTTITAFLRGMSKMSEIDAIHKQMVAEWTSQNGQLGSSKRDIEVLGVRVPQGTPFPEFYQKNLGRMLKNQDKQSRSQQASTGQAIYFNISP